MTVKKAFAAFAGALALLLAMHFSGSFQAFGRALGYSTSPILVASDQYLAT